MSKKALGVWVSSSMTAAAVIHLFDAMNALFSKTSSVLLKFYFFLRPKLETVTLITYFLTCAATTFTLWGLTCLIAFENPVETFPNKILSEAKKHSALENQVLDQKSELLDIINETVEANNELLANVKDMICNVRVEVKEIQQLKDCVERIEIEMDNLRKEIKKIEGKINFPVICVSCGKPILPEFEMCPYCGESLKPIHGKAVSVIH